MLARARRQDGRQATYAPRPKPEDLRLSPTMSARQLYAFARGVGRWYPLFVEVGGERFQVDDALACDAGAPLPAEWALVNEILHLRCADGNVALRIAADRSG